MALSRVTKAFDYFDEHGYPARKTFISPSVEWGEVVTGYAGLTINPEELKTDPLVPNNGAGYIFDDLLTNPASYETYYFGKDDAFNYFDRLAGTLGYDVESFAEKIIDDVNTEIARNQGMGELRLTDQASYSNKAQALWGTDPQYARPLAFVLYNSNQFNPSDFSRTVNVYVRFCVGGQSAFDDNTGLWSREGGSAILASAFCIGKYNSNYLKTAISRVLTTLTHLYLKPAAGFGVLGSNPTFTFTRGGDFAQKVWCYGYLADDTIFLPELLQANALIPVRGNYSYGYFTTPYWNEGGTVDPDPPEPEPPGPEPDPYPPIDPNPPTPDPPDPVDPVDPVPEPDDPPLGACGLGLISVYNPSATHLRQIGAALWNDNILSIINRFFKHPLEAVIGLSIIPVTPQTGSPKKVMFGIWNSQVSVPRVTSDYVTYDCGTVYIPKFFNSYLDYDPYTKYQLYLPYIGEIPLNADEITSKRIGIKYKCNVINGDCVALIMIGTNVIAQYNGNFQRPIPMSQANYDAIVQAGAGVATAGIALAAAGVGAAGMTGAIAATHTKRNGELNAAGQMRQAGVDARMSSAGANAMASTLNSVMNGKMNYNKSGSMSQGAGQISVQFPFITITRPNLTLPEGTDQASRSALRRYIGYPSNKYGPLSSFHGLTIVEQCQLASQHATDGEIAEALGILKGGVIL